MEKVETTGALDRFPTIVEKVPWLGLRKVRFSRCRSRGMGQIDTFVATVVVQPSCIDDKIQLTNSSLSLKCMIWLTF